MLFRGLYICIFCFCLLLSSSMMGQNGNTLTAGAYSIALGQARTALTGGQALNGNPAGLATAIDFGIQVSSEQRFALTDINATTIGIVKRFDNQGSFSLHIANYGLEEFRQSKMSIGYARKLAKKVNAGIKFNMWNTRIDGYGSNANIAVELGLMSEISRELRLGFHLQNPIGQSVSETTDLNSKISIGMAYQTTGKYIILADISKEIDQPEQFHAGILYQAMDQLDFKIGFATSPALVTFGVGFNLSEVIRFDGATRYHQNLGNTPSVSIGYFKQ